MLLSVQFHSKLLHHTFLAYLNLFEIEFSPELILFLRINLVLPFISIPLTLAINRGLSSRIDTLSFYLRAIRTDYFLEHQPVARNLASNQKTRRNPKP